MARVKRKNPYEPAVRAVIEDLQAQLKTANENLAVAADDLAASKAALKEAEAKASKDRGESLDAYAKNLEAVRREERDRRKSAYETMTLYAAQLRSGLMILRSNGKWAPGGKDSQEKFDEAVKALTDAKPPKEVRDALQIVLDRLDEAMERGARTGAIVDTMIDAEFPKVETDSISANMWSVLGGVGMLAFGAYALFAGFGGKKAGAGWGGP